MAYVAGYFDAPHQSQYGHSTRLSHMGCTPTSGANGVNISTGGTVTKTGDQILALVPQSEETNPATPGWSLGDLNNAMKKVGIPFLERSGSGWAAVVTALNQGLAVAVQGDSDQFLNGNCSGAFDGDHCILINPAFRMLAGLRQRWIHDPICPDGRWEFEYILGRYAKKFNPDVYFAVYTTPVPKQPVPAPPPVNLRFGAKRLVPPQLKQIRVPVGRKANFRNAPTTKGTTVTARLANGTTWQAYQIKTDGEKLCVGNVCSSVWYGSRTGNSWTHASSF